MAFTGTILDIYYDVLLSTIQQPIFYNPVSGVSQNTLAYGITYQQLILARIRYCAGSWTTPYPINNVAAALANVDNTFNDAGNLALGFDGTTINQAGDWTGAGTANFSLGQVSVRMNGNQANAIAKLLNNASLSCNLEVNCFDSGNFCVFSTRFPFAIYGRQDASNPANPPPPVSPGIVLLSTALADAKYMPLISAPDQAFTLIAAGGTKAIKVKCGVDGAGNPVVQETAFNPYP